MALETVLANVRRFSVDRIVCLGDVAATGPQPRACLHRLRELGCPVVRGNTEDWLLNPQRSPDADAFMQVVEEIDLWCAQQISTDDLAYMRSFAPVVDVPLGWGYQRSRSTADARNVRWAEYAWLRYEHDQPNIELRRVPVDADAVVRATLASGMPHAAWWVADWRA